MKRIIEVFLITLISFTLITSNTSSYTIYVEGEKATDTEYDKASVYVDNNTTIYDGTKKLDIKDLEEGLMVEIIFEGAVAESYPVQADAKKIYILDEKI